MNIAGKTIVLGLLAGLMSWPVLAQQDDAAAAAAERERQMVEKRREVELEMHRLRLELIKTDPDMSRLHEKIVALHKELQIKIDSNPMMQRLIKKADQIDRELKRSSSTEKK